MGDTETTVDDVTTDVDTETDTTDTQDVSDDGVALLQKYKIDPANFTEDDLLATLKRLEKAERVKREEKSKKKEVSEPTKMNELEEMKLRLFFVENEEARQYKDKFIEVKAKYPDMSFDDALDLAKSKTPKESTTVKEGFQGGGFKPKPKAIEQMSEEEALELPTEQYMQYLKKTGKIMS